MQQYEEYLERIKKYFEYDEVISNENIISVYDLICILEDYLSKLNNILYNEKPFIKAIEDYYSDPKLFGKFLKKLRVSLAKIDFISYRYSEERASIYIRFKEHKMDFWKIMIYKDRKTNELYFDGDKYYGKDKDFVNYFRDTILTNLQALEDYFDLFKLSIPDLEEIPCSNKDAIRQEIDDDFLRVTIIYDTYGLFRYKVDIVNSIDKDDIYHRTWLDHESIKEYVDKNISELLKRIPADIDKLKLTTQEIIKNYYIENKENTKTLALKGVSL